MTGSPFWRLHPLLSSVVLLVSITATIRGVLYLTDPGPVTAARDFDELRKLDPGFVTWGTMWLIAGVFVTAILLVGHRFPIPSITLPVVLVVFAALQLGWAVAFIIAALERHPFGAGFDGALNYVVAAVGCCTLAQFVATGIARQDAIENAPTGGN